mmetsp:Transcript_7575/g.20695  ORF Transcript_7575/g.20695 Transcript_7575/m.20695 type:complete len:172 (-) Transcript_7575:1042-1557(-)
MMRMFSPRDPAKERAASKIQAYARGASTRSSFHKSKPELEREKRTREVAAAKIGAHFRGVRTRAEVSVIRGEKQFNDAQTKHGILEKRSARKSFILGSRQVVLWQRKYVRIHDFQFCYSNKEVKVRSNIPGENTCRARQRTLVAARRPSPPDSRRGTKRPARSPRPRCAGG